MAAGHDLRNSRTKFNRPYSEAELALFAQYVEQRAVCQPAACTREGRCWVLLGPPGLIHNKKYCCIECGCPPVEPVRPRGGGLPGQRSGWQRPA